MIRCTLEYIKYPRKSEYKPDDYIIGQFTTNVLNIPEKFRNGKKQGQIRFTGKGTGIPTEKRFAILLDGKWNMSEKYGLEMNVDKADISLPTDEAGIKLYLTKFLTGCGLRTADKIYKRFGSNTLFVLSNSPEMLMEVKGIRQKQAKKILNSLSLTKQYQELCMLLADFNVSKKQVEVISAVLKDKAVEQIKENPFILQKFRGFSFDTLDVMSVRFGCDPSSPDRIKSAVKAVLWLAMKGANSLFFDAALQSGGNLFVNQYIMRDTALKLLNQRNDSNVDAKAVSQAICEMAAEYELRGENGNAYLPENYMHENRAAQYIVEVLLYSKCKKYTNTQVEPLIANAEKYFSIELSPTQKFAVKMVLQNSVSVITGGAGTGKTTVLKVILFCLKHLGESLEPDNLLLAAPTGKAAIRMTEATGYSASTIHRGLGLMGEEEYIRDEADINYLDQEIIVCDEYSMSDMNLAYRLFIAIPRHKCRVLLLGDVGQLPSVGAGNVLNDIIDSGIVPVTKLDVIFRQAQKSYIVRNSKNIYEGIKDIVYGKDFLCQAQRNPQVIASMVVSEYMSQVQRYGLDEVVVLSPVRKRESGILSVMNLNDLIQTAINPPMVGINEHKFHGCIFRERDKVMNLKNREVESVNGRKVDICNGDTGIVKKIQKTEDGYVCVIDFSYGRTVEFDDDEMREVTLAYACTIHKSQGSEWKSVIMPLSQVFPSSMLTRNLIYTGITRAKKQVTIIGNPNVLDKAIDNMVTTKRNTALAYKIKKIYLEER